MWVDQLRQLVFFEVISSKLRMYKTLAVSMLLRGALRQFQQFKKMTMTSSAINHYQFSSCLRPYLFVCSTVRYPKRAQTASCHAGVSCQRVRGVATSTPNSIAAYAHKQCARSRFGSKKRPKNQQKLLCSQFSSTPNTLKGQAA